MNKQEEIRARIRSAIELAQSYVEGCCPIDDITDSLITELNSQGVVIKNPRDPITMQELIDCEVVEPLIKQ